MTDGQSSEDGTGSMDQRSVNDPSVKSSSTEDQVINHINGSKDNIPEIEADVQDKSPKQNGTPKHQNSNGKESKELKKSDKNEDKKEDKNKGMIFRL